jgi:hypothetical protein
VADRFDWLEPVAWAATALTVIIAILTVRAAHLQRRRQFETIYVQRYWTLLDQLSLDALRSRQRPQISVTDQRVIRSYLRLCEDELELRQAGWITRETWRIWQSGITAQLKRWPFEQVWSEVDRETGPKRPNGTLEEFALLRDFLSAGRDPLRENPRHKRACRYVRRLLTGGP